MRVLLFSLVLLAVCAAVSAFTFTPLKDERIQSFREKMDHLISINPPVVPSVNITQYLGRWHQMYGDFLTQNTFEKGAYCAVADYGFNSNGTISVHNQQRYNAVDGPIQGIFGFATASSTPGKLTVFLQGAPAPGPYWILLLGPVYNDQYEYAVVSDYFQATLFVLARDVERYYAKYDSALIQQLTSMGFNNFLNKPLKVVQEGCQPIPQTQWEEAL